MFRDIILYDDVIRLRLLLGEVGVISMLLGFVETSAGTPMPAGDQARMLP